MNQLLTFAAMSHSSEDDLDRPFIATLALMADGAHSVSQTIGILLPTLPSVVNFDSNSEHKRSCGISPKED